MLLDLGNLSVEEAHGVILLRGRCLSLYSLPEVAPSPVVLRGFGQACKWQMDNGRPRRSRSAHVLFMRRWWGRGWLIAAMPPVAQRQKHTLPTAAQPPTALRLRKFIEACARRGKKSGIFCSYMQSAVKKKAMIWIADHEDLTVW